MKRIIILTLVMVIFSSIVYSRTITGAKRYGMGGAGSAIVDNSSAVYWNPAALNQSGYLGVKMSGMGETDDLDELETVADFVYELEEFKNIDTKDHDRMLDLANRIDSLPEQTDLIMGGLLSANLYKLGAGILFESKPTINLGDAKEFTEFGGHSESIDIKSVTASTTTNSEFMIGLGTTLFKPPLLGSVAIGGSAKILNSTTETIILDPFADDIIGELEVEETMGFGADLGTVVTVLNSKLLNFKAGANFRNILTVMDEDDHPFERVSVYGVGANFKVPFLLSLKAAADLEVPENGDSIKRVGVEGGFGPFVLRAGKYGTELDDDAITTYGAGLSLIILQLDVATDSENYVTLSATLDI